MNNIERHIFLREATTQSSLTELTGLEPREVDRQLQKLRRAGKITFDRELRSWRHTSLAKVRSAFGGSSAPSALPSDGVVHSEDNAAEEPNKEDMSDQNVAAIDAAINNARTDGGEGQQGGKRARLTAEQRQARDAERDRLRAQKQAERAKAKEARRVAKDAEKRPAHMSKVEKAAAKLPALNDQASSIFTEATLLSRDQVAALSAHLAHFNRVEATRQALEQAVTAGDQVRIVGGDPRFVGQVGVVAKAQRIRCYVTLEGVKRPVYLFTSDVEKVEANAKAANA